MNTIQSIIIAIVEGLTEFLPISSTGHMIITEKLLNLSENDFSKVFTVAIQLGAILAVVVLYWRKFLDFKNWQFYAKLVAAVIPAIVLGLLFSKKIDALLESSLTVAISMLAGGIILIFIDNVFKEHTIDDEKDISFTRAILIGVWQCLAMIPGISRSAASIIGGMQQKLTRHAAAEFSFFLAVPTMLAATGYKLYKYYKEYGGFSSNEIQQLAIGNIVAFVVAMLAIKFFIGFLKKHGFRVWGYYRIVVGLALLVLILTGYISR
ncbi:MAG TPA: undecaprenyl-diphosphate phosphatase [Ferruginibacter sp.]|jgi:undecaprenyl-diphosphatase|nr:undecaprenyl-diphosphate phosphatase [Ferruginibacter sp.]MBN8698272.1 undecaprenyl-diphosphate phosphatase [Chitinophagales bacterium]HMU72286.1 undecaprenyl-diphosphate phosphatase [Ferruginibacter sp.]HMW26823.1 undecaprenyl-diphosphate phosphatase [Ferruginibacter sp.]HMX36782.1 undecaprenyl-diphosphate phosphatase [Ferruginibacter sp.]